MSEASDFTNPYQVSESIDLKEYNIIVNILLPGRATNTGMVAYEYKERYKLLNPDIVAKPAIFPASDERATALQANVLLLLVLMNEKAVWRQNNITIICLTVSLISGRECG